MIRMFGMEGSRMGVVAAELVRELKTLRKGRAVFIRQIGERLGSGLSQVCGVAEGDGPAEVRKKISDRIEVLAAELPEDLRLAVLVAFALHRDARHPFYKDRVRWVARHLRRDERTARRRIDEGIERLAELATSLAAGRGLGAEAWVPPWHNEELRVALLVDRPVPEVLEFRRIVSDRDDLSELDLALTLTGPVDRRRAITVRDLNVDLLYGGVLVPRGLESVDRFAFVLQLPRRLDRFDRHEFALRYHPREGQPMQPYYACVLRQRCDLFDLRVRFDRANLPRQVRCVAGAFQRDLEDPVPRGEILLLNQAGELHLRFTNLTPGLAYGIRWED
jgi:hypothetical protein